MELLRHYSNRTDVLERVRKLSQLNPSRPLEAMPEISIRRHRRLAADQAAELVVGYEAGMTVSKLGTTFRINPQTVSAILKRQGVKLRWRKRTPEIENQACRLYLTGLSLAAVGAQLDISASTVLNILKDKEVVARPVGTNQWQ